jgi:hypothetical protein
MQKKGETLSHKPAKQDDPEQYKRFLAAAEPRKPGAKP